MIIIKDLLPSSSVWFNEIDEFNDNENNFNKKKSFECIKSNKNNKK